MRIAIFTDTFYPQIDGIVTSTISLAKELANRGHQIFIFAPKPRVISEFSHPGVKVIRIRGIPAPFYPGFKITTPIDFRAINYLRKNKIQLIHIQTPSTIGASGIIASKLLRLPLVGTYHTLVAHPEYRKHMILSHPAWENLSWAYARAYYNKCNLITCPSETIKKELLKYKFKENIKVISNGIDLSKFKELKEVKKIKNSLLFVGRIAHEKNVFYLLDCFKLVLEKMPDAKLIVVGDGPQMPDFKKRVKELKLEKKVIIKGSVKHDVLIKSGLIRQCNIFVTASVTENQPITILEAQANGTPCIAVDGGGMKDLVKNSYNGYLIEDGKKQLFADRVVSLLSNEKLLKSMSKKALKDIKNHDLPKTIDTWEKTYSNLIINRN